MNTAFYGIQPVTIYKQFPGVAEPVRIPNDNDEKWNKGIAELEARLIAGGNPPNWDNPTSLADFGYPSSGFVTMAQIEIERRRIRREREQLGKPCVCSKCGGAVCLACS